LNSYNIIVLCRHQKAEAVLVEIESCDQQYKHARDALPSAHTHHQSLLPVKCIFDR